MRFLISRCLLGVRWVLPMITAFICISTWQYTKMGTVRKADIRSADLPLSHPLKDMLNYCSGANQNTCARPLINFKQRYRISKKYRLMGCAIEKNFSTLLTAILCFLHNEERFRKKKRDLLKEDFHHRFCGYSNEFTNISGMEEKLEITKSSKWIYIGITRDPIDRFVSGFVDKCLKEETWRKHPDRCNQCKRDLRCFTRRMYRRILKRSNGNPSRTSFDDDHFFPQSWRCEFHHHLQQYTLLKFDAARPRPFINELLSLAKHNGVPQKSIKYINDSLTTGRTEHSTQHFELRKETELKLRADPELMDMIIKMYYYDFTLFGYKLPEFV